jgi:hypothetical protein
MMVPVDQIFDVLSEFLIVHAKNVPPRRAGFDAAVLQPGLGFPEAAETVTSGAGDSTGHPDYGFAIRAPTCGMQLMSWRASYSAPEPAVKSASL